MRVVLIVQGLLNIQNQGEKRGHLTVSGVLELTNQSPHYIEELDFYIGFSMDGRLVGELTLTCDKLGPGATASWPLKGHPFSGQAYETSVTHWGGYVCDAAGVEVDVEELTFALDIGVGSRAYPGFWEGLRGMFVRPSPVPPDDEDSE